MTVSSADGLSCWRRRGARWYALALVCALLAGPRLLAAEVAGASELFRRGVEALREGDYPDAESLFRLSFELAPEAATMCNLALTYERWRGHDRQALDAYRRCADEDDSGRYRERARERARELEARLRPEQPSRPPTTASAIPSVGARPASGPVPISLTWRGVRSTRGCFFFSGPGRLGRDARLGDRALWQSSAGSATLVFDGGASFSGTRTGDRVALSRRSVYTSGGRWTVTESIEGVFVGSELRARYSYRECDESRRQGCPTRCTIAADIAARPASP